MATERYNPRATEQKWQSIWGEKEVFKTDNNDPREKYYVLEMFPYPSGRIHMGHVRNYAMGMWLPVINAPVDSMFCTRWGGMLSVCRQKMPLCNTKFTRKTGLTRILLP